VMTSDAMVHYSTAVNQHAHPLIPSRGAICMPCICKRQARYVRHDVTNASEHCRNTESGKSGSFSDTNVTHKVCKRHTCVFCDRLCGVETPIDVVARQRSGGNMDVQETAGAVKAGLYIRKCCPYRRQGTNVLLLSIRPIRFHLPEFQAAGRE